MSVVLIHPIKADIRVIAEATIERSEALKDKMQCFIDNKRDGANIACRRAIEFDGSLSFIVELRGREIQEYRCSYAFCASAGCVHVASTKT